MFLFCGFLLRIALFFFFSHVAEIAQLTSFDSGIAETPDTDDSVSVSGFDVNCEIVT